MFWIFTDRNVMRNSPNHVLRPIKNFYQKDPYFSPVWNKRKVAPTVFVLTMFWELLVALNFYMGSHPHVIISMSDFCTHLAWPHLFPRLPWNFLTLPKQPHLRALSNGCMVSSCLASLCFKSRDKCLWAELVTSSNGVE